MKTKVERFEEAQERLKQYQDGLIDLDLQLFGNDDDEDDDDAKGGGSDDDDVNVGDDDDDSKGGDEPKLTQAEVNKLIERRLGRARKAWEKEQEEARKKEQMTTEERLKAEKEEAEKKALEREASANARTIKAEAKALAASLGVKPERINYAVRLADLSGIEVDDDGEPDTKAIKSALEQVTKDLPELKGAPGKIGDPSNPGGGSGGGKADMNALIRRRSGRR